MTGLRLLVASLVSALVLVGAYAAFGGTRYTPRAAANPCGEVPLTRVADQTRQYEQLALVAIARAGCSLGVSRGELTLALLNEDSLRRFERRHGLPDGRVEAAARSGVHRTLDDATRQRLVDSVVARVLETAVDTLPLPRLVDTLTGRADPCAPYPWRRVDGTTNVLTEVALVGLSKASCTLRVPPLDFALALQDNASLKRFEQERRIDDRRVEDAVRNGLNGGVDEADHAGQLNTLTAFLARQVVERLSFSQLLNVLRTGNLDLTP